MNCLVNLAFTKNCFSFGPLSYITDADLQGQLEVKDSENAELTQIAMCMP